MATSTAERHLVAHNGGATNRATAPTPNVTTAEAGSTSKGANKSAFAARQVRRCNSSAS